MARSDVKAIRADVRARLLAASTDAGDRVYVSRVLPFSPEDLVDGPAVVFGAQTERHEWIGQPPFYRTTTTCTVDHYATASDEETLQDTLDDVVGQVESTLFASSFRDQFDQITNIMTQSAAEQLEDAHVLFGRVGMSFDLIYTTHFVPVESRPAFTSAKLNFDFDADDDIDVESLVEAP